MYKRIRKKFEQLTSSSPYAILLYTTCIKGLEKISNNLRVLLLMTYDIDTV